MQQQGVTLRVCDVRIPLEEICTLKPGRTPTADKLMRRIDFSSCDDFGDGGATTDPQPAPNRGNPADGTPGQPWTCHHGDNRRGNSPT